MIINQWRVIILIINMFTIIILLFRHFCQFLSKFYQFTSSNSSSIALTWYVRIKFPSEWFDFIISNRIVSLCWLVTRSIIKCFNSVGWLRSGFLCYYRMMILVSSLWWWVILMWGNILDMIKIKFSQLIVNLCNIATNGIFSCITTMTLILLNKVLKDSNILARLISCSVHYFRTYWWSIVLCVIW